MSRCRPLAFTLALALTACQPPALTAPGGGMIENRVGGSGVRLAPKIAISGQAQAPASLVANGGASVISNGGGTVIANGGGSILANGGAMFTGPDAGPRFALLAAEALAPVAGAEVTLLAADGRPFPGVAPAKTDAQGRFSLTGVPEGSVGFVEIKGKGFRLGRLMKAAASESLRVDPVSTAVADGVRAQLKDPRELAQIKPDKLKALEDAVQAASDAGEIQIDLKQGGSADQALAKALEKRPEAAQAAQAAVADAKKAAAEAPPEAPDAAAPAQPATPAEPAQPAQPGDGAAQAATPAQPAAPAGGGDRPAPDNPPPAAQPSPGAQAPADPGSQAGDAGGTSGAPAGGPTPPAGGGTPGAGGTAPAGGGQPDAGGGGQGGGQASGGGGDRGGKPNK